MQKFDVWMEGYACTGNSADATFLGRIEAYSFKEAVYKVYKVCKKRNLSVSEHNGVLSSWHCRFFDNEKQARQAFG